MLTSEGRQGREMGLEYWPGKTLSRGKVFYSKMEEILSFPSTLRYVRWGALVLPLLFVASYLYLVTRFFYPLSDSLVGLIILWAPLGLAISVFTLVIFRLIGSYQRVLIRQNRERDALLTLVRQVAISLNLDEVLTEALRAVVKATRAEASEIWLTDSRGQQVVMRQRYGNSTGAFAERTTFPLGEGIPGLVAASGEAITTHSLQQDPRFLRQQVKKGDYNTLCAFPLRSAEEVLGVLALAAHSPEALTNPGELRLAEAMCHEIASAVKQALLHEQVQQMAVITERERIARELHDGMAQVLTYVNTKALAVERLLAHGDKEEASQQLQQMVETVRQLYSEVRESILTLRTQVSGDTDLLEVIRRFVVDFENLNRLQIHCQLEVSPELMAQLEPTKEVQLLRIIQEALTNVRKHAQTSEGWLILRPYRNGVEVVVKDKGRGFDQQQLRRDSWPHFGLHTMNERAKAISSTLEIHSAPGQGTTVTLKVPVGLRGNGDEGTHSG